MAEEKKKITSFRTTSVMMIGSVMLLFIVIFFAILQSSVSGMLLKTEAQNQLSRLEMARNFLTTANIATQQKAQDISYWRETVLYAKGKNPSFVTQNWPIISPSGSTQLTLLVLKDLEGEDLARLFYDYEGHGPLPLPAGMDAFLRKHSEEVIQASKAQ